MTASEERREGLAALGAAARAFTQAQRKGYAWIGEQGCFETCEPDLNITDDDNGQLRLA